MEEAAGACDDVVPVAGEGEVAEGDADAEASPSPALSFLKILDRIPMIDCCRGAYWMRGCGWSVRGDC